MRKIITTTFISLDGVMQAPGGPTEDTSNGFKFGGWQFGGEEDEVVNKLINEFMTAPFELLLGRRTYDIFAAYWPNHTEITNVAKPFNSTKKYVVSHKPFELSWNNSELITVDVVAEIKKLKHLNGPDLVVWGSGKLIQTLLKHNLIDRMHIWTYPITIGTGKKLFAEGTQPERFKPVDIKITSTGVVFATYEPSEPLKTG
ncbi:dihydrofolate reductase family protein [soil metagenome]